MEELRTLERGTDGDSINIYTELQYSAQSKPTMTYKVLQSSPGKQNN